jgi:parvulin-like peptidyl-prolyl isomerase
VINKILKEPLVHFLLIGALLFFGYGFFNREPEAGTRTVQITAAEANWLKETWARQWHRPPSEEEFQGLLAGYLKETLLAREAEAMGLAQNDTVIRRRLAQKMEFLVQDTARLTDPGDEVLRQFHDANFLRYRRPVLVSFTQIFFKTLPAAQQALVQLPNRHPDSLGDASMLARDHAAADLRAVQSQFGEAFGAQLFALEAGQWQGPLASTYGYHLVRVTERQEATPRPFAEIRAQVLADWQRDQQDKASERYFAELRKKYTVVVDDSLKPLLGATLEAKP